MNATHATARVPLVDRLDPSAPIAVTGDRLQLDVPPCWGRVLVVE